MAPSPCGEDASADDGSLDGYILERHRIDCERIVAEHSEIGALADADAADLVIAMHAVAYGLTLVTADRAFERLRLRQENWLA